MHLGKQWTAMVGNDHKISQAKWSKICCCSLFPIHLHILTASHRHIFTPSHPFLSLSLSFSFASSLYFFLRLGRELRTRTKCNLFAPNAFCVKNLCKIAICGPDATISHEIRVEFKNWCEMGRFGVYVSLLLLQC